MIKAFYQNKLASKRKSLKETATSHLENFTEFQDYPLLNKEKQGFGDQPWHLNIAPKLSVINPELK